MKTLLLILALSSAHFIAAPVALANAHKGCLTYVKQKAKQLAKHDWQPVKRMGENIRNLNYMDYHRIKFIAGETLWRDEALPFQAEFMHPGMQFDQAIKLHIWDAKQQTSTPIPFSRKYFHYDGMDRYFDGIDMGYTGLRLLYPIMGDGIHNEFLVFQGASYFRSRGKEETYGLSARGIALNTTNVAPEEFPTYTEFWLEKPDSSSKTLRLCALMDSPSLSGATEFTITPDKDTLMDVDTVIYPRTSLQEVGIAPLTSMFFHGESSLSKHGDYRPEVHDSDGLLIQTKHEWQWHPLREAEWTEIRELVENQPIKGFGLMQRDRHFAHYQDLGAEYERRTSAWIEPLNNWGKGKVKLMHHSTDNDVQDNVVTFWQPQRLQAGKHYQYRLHWGSPAASEHPLGKVHATRLSTNDAEMVLGNKKLIRFIIDVIDVEKTTTPPTINTTPSSNVEVSFKAIEKNPHINGWRVLLYLQPKACEPLPEINMQLIDKDTQKPLSETWFYRVQNSLCLSLLEPTHHLSE